MTPENYSCLGKQAAGYGKNSSPSSAKDGLGICSSQPERHRGQRYSFEMRLEKCWMPHQVTWNKVKNSSCTHNNRNVLAMRTSSQRLAAVRKREAMLLESVYSRSFCRNLASYLKKGKKKKKEESRKARGKEKKKRSQALGTWKNAK